MNTDEQTYVDCLHHHLIEVTDWSITSLYKSVLLDSINNICHLKVVIFSDTIMSHNMSNYFVINTACLILKSVRPDDYVSKDVSRIKLLTKFGHVYWYHSKNIATINS